MTSFQRYYEELLEREGVQSASLVAVWNEADVRAIVDDISRAVRASSLFQQDVPIRPGSTNQSVGNQVEEFLISSVNRHLAQFDIQLCSGKGYPDRELVERATGRRFPLELKATSQWNPSDSNRRVLTSSSKKLRERFAPPIHHLLITVSYRIDTGRHRVSGARFDFLQPSTEVEVRFEASVNHKILSTGSHPSRVVGNLGIAVHGELL